ncbi:MAG: Asp-tRNA(Asn)/Glu-tRNA(Gln) amidotransferase subunit GatC [Sediminibacterium sp.]|nr:Asp-tRNA(Asn)/Glu-tRNA(Gln) amidotransferase subunit GatC [Sediminibacterium sp.]
MQLFSKNILILAKKGSKTPLVASFNLLTKPSWGFSALEYICTMQVDHSLVNHLAHLSRLNVAPEKMDKLVQDMQDLVGFVEQLNALDTTGTKPLMHMSHAYNVLRADEVGGAITNQEALSNALDAAAPYFKVPKVIRK